MNLNIIYEVYKKTFAYGAEKIIPNGDGTITRLHSDKFLDEHPERKDSPEFTEDEEIEQINYIGNVAFEHAKKYGNIFKNIKK